MPSTSGIARSARLEGRHARRAAIGRLDPEPFVAQHRLERESERSVVVDYENTAHRVRI
jgi:hypothetical protein